MASMGMATLRLFWHQLTSTPWLCDGLVLGTVVAAISSTCALAFASALMKFPKTSPSSYYSASSSDVLQKVALSNDCPECNALRLYSHLSKPIGYSATLLEFSSDSLLTETIMSFTISFIIVTFAVFLVRELR
jgi:hypothetical protein